jgi:hypothetical protein
MVKRLLGQPNDIRLDMEGITRQGWLHRRRYIAWQEVVRVAYNKSTGNTVVYGKDGTRIRHAFMHDDPKGFQGELERRAHIHVDAPKGLSL